MKAYFFILVLVINFISGCSTSAKTHMTQTELLKAIEAEQAPIIIDVRSQTEYDSGHVPGAIHVPFWKAYTPDALARTGGDELLVLYCAHGPRAGIAQFALKLSGFDNIVYLEGHMSAWKAAKLPVEIPAQ
jgi:rhodanese-related sulfurtransferase